MRFMMFVQLDPSFDRQPTAEEVAAMSVYNEELVQSGVLLQADGLHPPVETKRLVFSGGRATVTDGPYAEAKEVVGGYWVIDVKTKEEAVEWASRAPMGDGDAIELRQVYEMSEFPEDVQAAAQLSQEPSQQTSSRY